MVGTDVQKDGAVVHPVNPSHLLFFLSVKIKTSYFTIWRSFHFLHLLFGFKEINVGHGTDNEGVCFF
jgi:hypothetical protein